MNAQLTAQQYQRITEIRNILAAEPIADPIQTGILATAIDDPDLSSELAMNAHDMQSNLALLLEFYEQALIAYADRVIRNSEFVEVVEDSEISPQGDVIYTLTDGSAVIVTPAQAYTHMKSVGQ